MSLKTEPKIKVDNNKFLRRVY